MTSPRVAVIGAGVTGLTAAWHLRRTGASPTVFEAGDRVGGKIRGATFAGAEIETGPDTFLARVPWAVDLCRDLGIDGSLVSPRTGRAYLWTRGRLRPIPSEGLVLGTPSRLRPLARAGVLSPLGLARAALEPVLPATHYGDDPSVRFAVGARFGREVVDRLVEPLIGGINAGRADSLSLAAAAPDIATALRADRSLMRGLRKRKATASAGPVFLAPKGGLTALVERLAVDVDVQLGAALEARPKGFDATIVAVPAHAAAPLLPEAAEEVAAIDHASVGIVTLAYRPEPFPTALDGSGFLVPRVDGRLMTAATWISSKWGTLGRDGLVLVRCSTGRFRDERFLGHGDEELVRLLHAELAEAMALPEPPVEWRVDRWIDGFPQYDVGHLQRVARIEAALPAGVFAAGAAYRGVGIASCIRQGREAAEKALAAAS